MPTSATGNNRAGTAGFTLVELMVVLFIVGMMSAAAILAFPDPRGAVADDARGFAARLVAARDLSIIGGHDIGVRIDGTGYGFAERRSEGWQAVGEKALQPRKWSDGIETAARIEGGDALVFDTTGIATPATISLRRGDTRARITVDTSGAVHVDGG